MGHEEVNLLIVAYSGHCSMERTKFLLPFFFFVFFFNNLHAANIFWQIVKMALTKKNRLGKTGFHLQLSIQRNLLAQTSNFCICSKFLRESELSS